jgi:hypothetical protein
VGRSDRRGVHSEFSVAFNQAEIRCDCGKVEEGRGLI